MGKRILGESDRRLTVAVKKKFLEKFYATLIFKHSDWMFTFVNQSECLKFTLKNSNHISTLAVRKYQN